MVAQRDAMKDGCLLTRVYLTRITQRNLTVSEGCAQILRVIDSLQLTAQHSVATPVNWKHGDRVVAVPCLTDEQVTEKVAVPAFSLNIEYIA